MTVPAFIDRHNLTVVTAPGGLGGQCVDLANLYLAEELRQPHIWADACQWRNANIKGVVWTSNGPFNFPPIGSLVVWCQSASAGVGVAGHIALVVAADVRHLVTFDQNWPIGSPCHMVTHSYSGVVGWHQPV
jgi:CHAP domain